MRFDEWLKGKEKVRLGFLGGSITEGAGASAPANRYASRLTAKLGKRYPDTAFEEINAGIGGTPSALGLFRVTRDVLAKAPDVLFVEFCVNDGNEDCSRYMEGIVRAALRYRRDMPIFFLYTYMHDRYALYEAGQTPSAVAGHHKIASAYHIPEVDLATDLFRKIRDYGGDNTFFMKDACHPNDDGYATYVDTLMAKLPAAEVGEIAFPEEPVSGVEYRDPRIVLASAAQTGWPVSYHSLYGRTENYIYAATPGESLTYRFTGCIIGLFIALEKDSGVMEVEVDGKKYPDVSTWDKYALQFNRSGYCLLAEGLEAGEHTLKITVSEKKDEQSEGHFIRIGAFLVA